MSQNETCKLKSKESNAINNYLNRIIIENINRLENFFTQVRYNLRGKMAT